MKSTVSPTLKTGDTNDIKIIGLLSLSMLCQNLLYCILELFLSTTDNQFGFKNHHSTDVCIFAIKQYSNFSRLVYYFLFSASKEFDQINHWIFLFLSTIIRIILVLFMFRIIAMIIITWC